MSFDLKISVQQTTLLTPQQRKLKRLIDKIEQQKHDLASWENAQIDIQNYTRSKLLPIYSELHAVLFEQLNTLWNHLASDAFSKVDLAQIDSKIAALAAMLKKSQMLNTQQKEQVEKINTFYLQHAAHLKAKKTKAMLRQRDDFLETIEQEIEQEIEVDWGNYEYDSVQYEAERERAKHLKQQEKREQAAKMAEQSLKTIYLKITAMIHPDREPDEVKKLEKTELLQTVNAAYTGQDLFYLLKLQLDLEQGKGQTAKDLTAEQVKFYQIALEAQSQKLESQMIEIFDSFHLDNKVKLENVHIGDVYKAIDADCVALKQQLKTEKERLKYMERVKGLEMLLGHGVL
ncbi:molecular chaperone DnaJ [Acinetobacter piscicola]|uniref:molecular chaperone DnaJ n=1 Tax=Acinetobacter piscicola TaxID=2006115 RepID=UPI000B7CE6ED|nr:molecular chaperone DnaJ [Acinetobacter piscicola]